MVDCRFNWCAPAEEASGLKIDVSSYGGRWAVFSPFYKHGGIPIPGMPGRTSDSVEGIWQGLKIIDGKTDETYFRGRGRKRRGKPSGHLLEGRCLDYVEARRLIYIPAYTWMVRNRCRPDVEAFLQLADEHGEVWVHDVESNPDVEDLSAPLSHAAVLVSILKRWPNL